MFLARVRVSSEYFPVLDIYSCAIKRSWLSLWLGLAVDIFQFWNVFRTVQRRTSCFSLGLAVSIFQFWIVYHTVAQGRDRGSLSVDRVSSGYFPVLECISYNMQGLRVSR